MGFKKIESKIKKIGLIRIAYQFILRTALMLLRIVSLFGTRYTLFFQGRAGLKAAYERAFINIPKIRKGPVIWMHCASLGEFEQGRPVLERIRSDHPDAALLLTFFSPSGYEIRKNYPLADAVMYLPVDTSDNARWFLDIVRPSVAVLVKYDFWPELLLEIRQRKIPAVAVASIFRPDQIYFRWYGGFFRDALQGITHFFVQDQQSKKLLQTIGISSVTVAGDTRFDRVLTIRDQAQDFPLVLSFINTRRVLVMGSTWSEDLQALAPFVRKHQNDFRFIVVPHHTDESTLSEAERILDVPVWRLSVWEKEGPQHEQRPVLLVDKIGMLSALYRYAHYAWIGGSFATGLHNTLEAAVFGIPVFFGNRKYRKFREAVALMEEGGACAVADGDAFIRKIEQLESSPERYRVMAKVAGDFVQRHGGATEKVVEHINLLLKS